MAQEKKIEIISSNSLDKDELLFPDANILKGSPNKQVHLRHDEMDIFSNNAINGFMTLKGNKIKCSKIILTTGTFLNGLIHIGDKRTPAGRYNEKPSTGLSEQLEKYKFKIGRLKTGTPPRLDARTINFKN